jgi:hypothetical protein
MGRTTRGDTAKAKAAPSVNPEDEAPKPVPAKVKKTEAKKKATPKKTAKSLTTSESSSAVAKTGISVTIEACKQWSAFKTRANKIVKALEGKANVVVNPEKPGKGNFVVRVNNGDPVIELLALKRPFPALKELDMDHVIEQVLKAVQDVGE